MAVGATFTGKVWVFDHDINTDLVIPNFAVLMTLEEQLEHCFSANRPGWVDEVAAGDVLVVGRNFGVGSARNIGAVFHALGISGVVAESFNGLGLRNCINAGLPSLPCPGVLSTQIRPSISATSRAEIDNPRPVPPYRRVIEPSACSKGAKIVPSFAAGMPMPVSATAK